ncbi:hypothetical protein SK128_025918, partial [Halocaridina rubra]
MEEHRAKHISKFPDASLLRGRLSQVGCCSRCLHILHDRKYKKAVKCKSFPKGNNTDSFCYTNFRERSQNVTESDTMAN